MKDLQKEKSLKSSSQREFFFTGTASRLKVITVKKEKPGSRFDQEQTQTQAGAELDQMQHHLGLRIKR